jgi:acetyltransferase-like isoleucine patch superfamily enzyme
MGMKIGRGTIINSTWISDPSMIELGKRVTIGGSVTMVAHYGQGGLLIIAPIKIGDGCTIGLKSSIMGGTTIGEKAKILPHSVVLPKTVIPAGETWGGVPAQKIESKKPLDSGSPSNLKIA